MRLLLALVHVKHVAHLLHLLREFVTFAACTYWNCCVQVLQPNNFSCTCYLYSVLVIPSACTYYTSARNCYIYRAHLLRIPRALVINTARNCYIYRAQLLSLLHTLVICAACNNYSECSNYVLCNGDISSTVCHFSGLDVAVSCVQQPCRAYSPQ